jgi:hypothetical protein
MAQPTTDELRRLAREYFRRELSEAQAEAYRPRLPTMARNVQLLGEWTRRLQAVEPALVQQVAPAETDG